MSRGYYARMLDKAAQLRSAARVDILAIETSCDETAAAVVRNGREILGDAIFSQIDLHKVFGGVVPEIASRSHVETVGPVVREALDKADMAFADIDAVAVTQGPGLVGALLCGLSAAKGYAYGLDVPLVGVNHIEAHLSANYLTYPELAPPFLGLAVSGGHTHWFMCDAEGSYKLLGATVDDAAGEAFDKTARIMGIPYPGGVLLDEAAENGDANAFPLPRVKIKKEYAVSFSGLKTAMGQTVAGIDGELPVNDLAASFRKAVVYQLVENTRKIQADFGGDKLVVAGGVAANRLLRREMALLCEEIGIPLYIPPISLCGDNAAMVGACAYPMLLRGEIADLDANAQPTMRLFT